MFLYDERLPSCYRSDSEEMMEIWGRKIADWRGICQDAGKEKRKALQISNVHLIFFALCICAWHRLWLYQGSPWRILWEKNPTFSYLPVSAHTKEVWGRLAAWNWENQCCMGRQSEGSTWRGAEDRMLLHNSWAFLEARVHFPVRTPAHNMPQQCSTRKGPVSA